MPSGEMLISPFFDGSMVIWPPPSSATGSPAWVVTTPFVVGAEVAVAGVAVAGLGGDLEEALALDRRGRRWSPVRCSVPWPKSRATPSAPTNFTGLGPPVVKAGGPGTVLVIRFSNLKPLVSALAMLLAMTSIWRLSTIWFDRPT